MRAGAWPDTTTRTVAARAILDGVPIDVDGVSLTSEMSSDLPIVGGAAVAVTDGSIEWQTARRVTSTSPQPFARTGSTWPPVASTPVEVEVGDGKGQWFRQMVGLVDSTTGSFESPRVSSRVVDYVDRLAEPVTHDALAAAMPPLLDAAPLRRVGVTGPYVTDMVARTAGFYATPPASVHTLLSAPNSGSLWPEVGICSAASQYGDNISYPAWQIVPGGVVASNAAATWLLARVAAPVTLTLTLPPEDLQGGIVGVYVIDDDGVGFYVSDNPDGTIDVGFRLPSTVPGVTLPRGEAQRLQITTEQAGGSLTLRVATSDGRTATTTNDAAVWSTSIRFTRVDAGGPGLLGAVLLEDTERDELLGFTPTASLRLNSIMQLRAMPAIQGDTAMSLLTDQAKAECASTWIDSDGVLRWTSRGMLEGSPAVATKTTELTVDNLAWSDNLESVRKKVVVQHRVPLISVNNRNTVLLWQSQQQSLDNGQVLEEWVTPGPDEDWLTPDLQFQKVTFGAGTSINWSQGSVSGVVLDNESGASAESLASTGDYSTTAEKAGNSYRITQTAYAFPAGKIGFTRVIEDTTQLPKWFLGQALPIFRGRGKVQWLGQTENYETGAVNAVASYEHDCKWFVQAASQRQDLAAWLAGKLGHPVPTVTAIEIDPDPRLELGDKVTIRDRSRTSLELDLVITGVRQSWAAGTPTMTLSGRVTRVLRLTSAPETGSGWDALISGWTEGNA